MLKKTGYKIKIISVFAFLLGLNMLCLNSQSAVGTVACVDSDCLAPYLNSVVKLAAQHQVTNLRQRTFVCPVNGPVWVNSGIFCYKIWVDGDDGSKINIESYNTLRRVPEGKLNFYQLDLTKNGYAVFSQNDTNGFSVAPGVDAVDSLFGFRFLRFASGYMIEITNTDPKHSDIFVEGDFAFSAEELERVQRRVSHNAGKARDVNPIPESGVFDSYGGDVMALFEDGRKIVVYEESTQTKRTFSLAKNKGKNGQDMVNMVTYRENEKKARTEGALTLDVFHNYIVHKTFQAEGYRPGIKITNGMEHITAKTEILVDNLKYLSENLLKGPFGEPVGVKPDHVYGLMTREGRIVLMTHDSEVLARTKSQSDNEFISFTVNLKKHAAQKGDFRTQMLYAFKDVRSLDLFRVETPVNPRLDKVYKAAEQRLRHSLNLFNFYREQKKSKDLLLENVMTGKDYIRSAIELLEMEDYDDLFEIAETSKINGLPIRLYMVFALAAKLKPEWKNFFIYKTFDGKGFNEGVRNEIYQIAVNNPAMSAAYPLWHQIAVVIGTNMTRIVGQSA